MRKRAPKNRAAAEEDEELVQRVSCVFENLGVAYVARAMMGGVVFMVDDKMCAGVRRGRMMARIGAEAEKEALKREGCEPMVHGKRAMRGFVFVSGAALESERALLYWLRLALAFNPLAQRSKK